MAHVKLTSRKRREFQIEVDGVDLSHAVMADGFKIEIGDFQPIVTLRIAATSLDVDLPDSVLSVLEVDTPDPVE